MLYCEWHLGGPYSIPYFIAVQLHKLASGTDLDALQAAIELEKMIPATRLEDVRNSYLESNNPYNLAVVVELDRGKPETCEDMTLRTHAGYPALKKIVDTNDELASFESPEQEIEMHRDLVSDWNRALHRAAIENRWTRLNHKSYAPLPYSDEEVLCFISIPSVIEWLRFIGLPLMADGMDRLVESAKKMSSEGKDSPQVKDARTSIASDIYPPSAKTRNSYLRVIDALTSALIKGRTGRHSTDSQAALRALQIAGINPPVDERTLANYLKDSERLKD